MKTPAGSECPYFYGNYYRGREQEECRLIGDAPAPRNWHAGLCSKCPVPGIILANECPNMILHAEVRNLLFGLRKEIEVKAHCKKTNREVDVPEIGCGECHPIPDIFLDSQS